MGRSLNVAIVGATGMVGRELLRVLEQRRFPIAGLRLLASARSAGSLMRFDGREYTVQYFERQRFEWHPGAWPDRYDVLLGRLGAQLLAGRS